jgi:hypothetical protein
MELVVDEVPTRLELLRREANGEPHSHAALKVEVRRTAIGSDVVTTIEIGASKLPPGAESLLRREVRRSSERIAALLDANSE